MHNLQVYHLSPYKISHALVQWFISYYHQAEKEIQTSHSHPLLYYILRKITTTEVVYLFENL